MSFVKKTWVNRLSEYPTRRILTDTTTGIEQTVTVSRDEGVITTEGDAFSAENMNDLEGRVDTAITGLETSFSNALTALKATAIAQAVGATGSTFTSVIAKLAEIINRGHISASLTPGNSYNIPAGYHDGAGSVSAVSMTDTYDATSRGTLDMGATNVARYVNTSLVPNYNSGTSNTITSNGTHDLGETNAIRYLSVAVPSNSPVIVETKCLASITIGFKLNATLLTAWDLYGKSINTALFTLQQPATTYGSEQPYSSVIKAQVSNDYSNWTDVSSTANNVSGWRYFRVYSNIDYQGTSDTKGCTLQATNVSFS